MCAPFIWEAGQSHRLGVTCTPALGEEQCLGVFAWSLTWPNPGKRVPRKSLAMDFPPVGKGPATEPMQLWGRPPRAPGFAPSATTSGPWKRTKLIAPGRH